MAIAFSIYSKIPVPQFEWKEEDMEYMMCFFPWIGGVIGLFFFGWAVLCEKFAVGNVCYALIGAAIPLMISGGFHVDGYMDTMDAFHSYQSREKKLEILKDSHIGAFAAIMLALYYMIDIAAISEIHTQKAVSALAAVFFLARCFSGIAVMTLQPAKKEGLLYTFASSAQKVRVKAAQTGYVDFVDVEIFTGDEIVKKIIDGVHAAGVKVVASNHDFHKTPAKSDIIYRLRKMQDMGADIPKIAVMPQNKRDVLTLLAATEEMVTDYADRPVITMSMAGTGVISRLCGEVFGSSMTFGAAKKASAPGQMGVEDLSTVLGLLHKSM